MNQTDKFQTYDGLKCWINKTFGTDFKEALCDKKLTLHKGHLNLDSCTIILVKQDGRSVSLSVSEWATIERNK